MALIRRLMREESRKFPALSEIGEQTLDGPEDLTQSYLVERLGAVTAGLLVMTSDEDSIGKYLRKSIYNWLVSRARRSASGSVRRSVENVLRTNSSFEKVPDHQAGAGNWRLTGTSVLPWSGSVDELLNAANSVNCPRVPAWRTTSRRSPFADRRTKIAVLHAVFDACRASLRMATITEVFLKRFPAPLVLLEAHSSHSTAPEVRLPVPRGNADDVATDEVALALSEFSCQERQLLGLIDDVEASASLLGCGVREATLHISRLKKKLVHVVGGDDEHSRHIALQVLRLCAQFEVEDRQSREDEAS